MGNLVMLIFSIGMFGSTFLLPLYLQNSMGYTAMQAGSVFLPVGILQGIMSPVAGKVSDKFSPKIPMIVGVIVLGISFLLNAQLSHLTEHSFVMTSLYLRGFAMGIIFTPMSNLSLLTVPREKMAQASGISNTVRQSVEQVKQKLSEAAIHDYFALIFLQEAIKIKFEELNTLKEHLRSLFAERYPDCIRPAKPR